MLASLAFVALTLAAAQGPAASQPTPTKLAIVHATVFDATGAAPKPDTTVLIEGNRIVGIGASNEISVPGGIRVVDARGKFLIPGLWDMHIHPDDPEVLHLNPTKAEKELWLPGFVANGVTAARDMGGDLELLKDWRARIESGALLGPRLYFGGPLVDGPKPMWPASIAVRNADEGRAAVRDLKARGADFVKVYSLLPRDAYFAIADESMKVGIPFEGHVPDAVTNAEASDAGQRSLEHLLGMIREIADPAALAEKRAAIDPSLTRFSKRNAVIDAMLSTQSPEREKALFAKLVANKTWICPTLIVWNRHIWFDPKDPESRRRLPYVPAYIREWWDPEKNVHLKDLDDEFRAGERKMYARGEELVRGMQKVGIRMMTGSDMGGNPHCFAGWGIHDELRLLVKAGLTPAEALIAASKNPAEFLGLGDRLGTIERGKLADLVLLRADPLADITNIGSIEAVVLNGELLDRARLDALLAKTRERCEKRM